MLPEIGVKLIVDGMMEFVRQTGQVNGVLADLGRNAVTAAEQVNKLGSANTGNVATGIDRIGTEATEASGQVNSLETEVKDLDQAGQQMGSNASGSGGWMSGVADMAVGAYQRLGAMVVEKLTAVFSQITQFVADAPNVAAQFQGAMLRFSAAAAIDDPVQVEKMRDLFLDLGAKLPVTTEQVTAAATELAKGGISIDTMAGGMLESLIKFSLAAEMDVPEAASTAVKFLGTFGDASWDAGQKVEFVNNTLDMLQKGANTSVLDASGFAGALIQSAGAAQTAGVELDDYMMSMAGISSAFGSASETATSLREVINRLNPTQKDARLKMMELGLITFDTQTLFDALAREGVQPLSSDIGELVTQLEDVLRAQKVSDSDIEKYFLSMGKNVFYADGKLRSMTEIVGELEKAFDGLTEEERGQAMRKIFEITGTQAAAKLMSLGTEGMKDYEKQMQSALGTAEMYERTFQGVEAAQINAEGSLSTLQSKIGDLFLPGMELYENAVAMVANTLSTFISILSGDWSIQQFQALSPLMQEIAVWILTAKNDLIDWWASLGPVMQPLVEIWDTIVVAFSDMWIMMQPMFADFYTLWAETFGDSDTAGIGGIVKIAIQLVVETIRVALQIILYVIQAALYLVMGIWELFGDSLVTVLVAAYDIVVITIEALAKILADVFGLINALITGDWAAMWVYAQNIYNDFVGGIIILVTTFATKFVELFYTIGKDIVVPMMNIVGTITFYLASIIDYVVNWISDLTGWFGKIDLAKSAENMMVGFIDEFKKYTVKMIADVKLFGEKILETFKNVFKFGSPSKVMKQYGSWIGEGLSLGINASVPDVASASSRMVSAIDKPTMTISTTTQSANNYYNLGVKTTASPTTIIRSYDVMRVMS